MSVDMLLDDFSSSKTEVFTIDRIQKEQRLRKVLTDSASSVGLASYVMMLSESKGAEVVAHGFRRLDGEPNVRVFRPTKGLYKAIESVFSGPVDLYQYSPKKNAVICVGKYVDD